MNLGEKQVAEVLAEKGYLVISTAGVSMMPMLRNRKDTVEIQAVSGGLHIRDVVLFQAGEKLILHRIIKQIPDGFLIRGDNCVESDPVRSEQILGVLVSFTRNGKRHTVNDLSYRIYARAIVLLHPLVKARLICTGLRKKVVRKCKSKMSTII